MSRPARAATMRAVSSRVLIVDDYVGLPDLDGFAVCGQLAGDAADG